MAYVVFLLRDLLRYGYCASLLLTSLIFSAPAFAAYPATATNTTYPSTTDTVAPSTVYNFGTFCSGALDLTSESGASAAIIKFNQAYAPGQPCASGNGQNCAVVISVDKFGWSSRTAQDTCPSYTASRTATLVQQCPAMHSLVNGQCTQPGICNSGDSFDGTNTCTHTTFSCNGTDVESGGWCTPAQTCPTSGTVGTGYLPLGTDLAAATANPNIYACVNGCTARILPPIKGYSRLINGVKNYYFGDAFEGFTGSVACTDAPPLATPPANTCPAGERVGFINSVAVCYPAPTPTDPNAKPPVTTTKDAPTTTTEPDGTTTTVNVTHNANGSTTTVTNTCTVAGACSTTTEETAPTDPINSDTFCQQNPTDPSCLKADPNTSIPARPSLYTPVSGKTFSTVLDNFVVEMKTKPFYAAATGFFNVNVGGGACPVWSTQVWVFDVTFDQQCSPAMEGIWPLISAVVLACASFLAFRWAFL